MGILIFTVKAPDLSRSDSNNTKKVRESLEDGMQSDERRAILAMTAGSVTIYTDGASRGNPGPAAWAYVVVQNGSIIAMQSGYIGIATNNVAEYYAIINGLEHARTVARDRVEIRSDSELVVRQITGRYRIRKEHLADLARDVHRLAAGFPEITYVSVQREHPCIQIADRLCNETLDAKMQEG
jgi:ribonuclease HI